MNSSNDTSTQNQDNQEPKFNECYFALTYLSTKRQLNKYRGTLSKKCKKGRIEYYIQYRKNGIRHEQYVRKADVPRVLKLFEKKKTLRDFFRKQQKALAAMSKKERAQVRTAMKLCMKTLSDRLLDEKNDSGIGSFFAPFIASDACSSNAASKFQRSSKNFKSSKNSGKSMTPALQMDIDGTCVRSRVELIALMTAKEGGCLVKYEPLVYTEEQAFFGRNHYLADFAIQRSDGSVCYWEHMGKLHESWYRNHQMQKLRAYRRRDIRVGKNLIVTISHDDFDRDRMVWEMACGGLISSKKALKMIEKSMNLQWDTYPHAKQNELKKNK